MGLWTNLRHHHHHSNDMFQMFYMVIISSSTNATSAGLCRFSQKHQWLHKCMNSLWSSNA
uniref:Uncharacterized protein n=1 Tax=Arundo donax TaxID=35708 RepID=A0A0A9FTR6_ARUDO